MPVDRAPQLLTSFTPPMLARPMSVLPEKNSIFGNTYNGVPNPMVPHRHPYPTRYHGPVFNYPVPSYGYEIAPYARSPFAGGIDTDTLAKKLLLWGSLGLAVSIGAIYLILRSEQKKP